MTNITRREKKRIAMDHMDAIAKRSEQQRELLDKKNICACGASDARRCHLLRHPVYDYINENYSKAEKCGCVCHESTGCDE